MAVGLDCALLTAADHPAGLPVQVEVSRPRVMGLPLDAEDRIRPVLVRLARDLEYSDAETREVLDISITALDAIFSGRREDAAGLVTSLEESRLAERLAVGDLEIIGPDVIWRGRLCHLTPALRNLLTMLVRAKGRTVSRDRLAADGFGGKTLDVQLCSLRAILPELRAAVQSVWGLGLRFNPQLAVGASLPRELRDLAWLEEADLTAPVRCGDLDVTGGRVYWQGQERNVPVLLRQTLVMLMLARGQAVPCFLFRRLFCPRNAQGQMNRLCRHLPELRGALQPEGRKAWVLLPGKIGGA